MSRYLTEQAVALLEPLGLVWVGLLIATVAYGLRRRWWSAVVTGLPVVILYIFGSTGLPGLLLRELEAPYVNVDLAKLPEADAIVLLGGGAQPARFEVADLHLTPAGDRIIMGMELARMGKAPVLVLGGNVAEFPEGDRQESETVRKFLVERKLVAGEVIALPACGDTHDEAMHTGRLARERQWKRVLLVTSANHMPRATAVFRAQGLEVIPAPCNFLTELSQPASGSGPPSIPRAGLLGKTGVWLHEKIGWAVYRHRGWLGEEPAPES